MPTRTATMLQQRALPADRTPLSLGGSDRPAQPPASGPRSARLWPAVGKIPARGRQGCVLLNNRCWLAVAKALACGRQDYALFTTHSGPRLSRFWPAVGNKTVTAVEPLT